MIEYHEDLSRGGGTVRTVACPFCGVDLRGREPPFHFVKCPEVPQ